VRFEVARAIAYAGDWRIVPSLVKRLGPATVKALASAATPQERNLLYISSPEFMHR
jgi:hypothetical protein